MATYCSHKCMTDTATIDTVAALMGLWPSDADFARDIGIKPSHGQTIKLRGSLPVDYWPATIAAAARRGFGGVTAELLMRLHAGERLAPPTAPDAAPDAASEAEPERQAS